MVRTILIVDDDTALLAELIATARREGYAATAASGFREAMRTLDTLRPDVLVTTLKLGAYNGLHLLLRGRADNPRLCGIVIGPKDPIVEREARALGASAYLARPATAAAIVDTIRRVSAAEDDDDGRYTSAAAMFEASAG